MFEAVKTHYKYGEGCAKIVQKLCGILGRNDASNESTVRRLIKNFEKTGSVDIVKSLGPNISRRFEQNIAIFQDSVSPKKSIRRRSQQLGIPKTSVQRVLSKDAHAYKIKKHKSSKTCVSSQTQKIR